MPQDLSINVKDDIKGKDIINPSDSDNRQSAERENELNKLAEEGNRRTRKIIESITGKKPKRK